MFRVAVKTFPSATGPGVCYHVNLFAWRPVSYPRGSEYQNECDWELCGVLMLTQLEWEQWLRMCEAFHIEIRTHEPIPADTTETPAAC